MCQRQSQLQHDLIIWRQKQLSSAIHVQSENITLQYCCLLTTVTIFTSTYHPTYFIIKPTRCINFTNLFWHETYMFRTVRLSIIRSLFTVHSAMVYVIQVCRQLSSRSCSKAVYKPVWHIPLLSVQWINSWWWTDELSETCKASWQKKFVKLVHLVGFITNKIFQFCKNGQLYLWTSAEILAERSNFSTEGNIVRENRRKASQTSDTLSCS